MTLIARLDPSLDAVLTGMRSLHYAAPAPGEDLPGHVRAGSAVRRWSERLVVLQDDVHALAVLDAEEVARPILLPLGADGRRVFSESLGNKNLKMDLEAGVALPDGRLLALGSGSRRVRERLVLVGAGGEVEVVEASALYTAWRACTAFAGSELNIEGCVVRGDRLVLFQRGNGAPQGGLEPVDATGEVELEALLGWLSGNASVPTLLDVRQYDLGQREGVRFGFTDAVVMPDGRIAFLAGAEDSPDAYHDGVVVGCRFGVIDDRDVVVTDIVEVQSEGVTLPSRVKLEGIEWVGEEGGRLGFVVVADMDDPEVPSRLGRLEVRPGR